MSGPLYMIQLPLGLAAFVRFLATLGLNTNYDEDLGYGTHAWLRATFGEIAPKPFRLFVCPHGHTPAKLLGYTRAGRESLLAYACTFAEPAARAVCNLEEELAAAALPGADDWRPGRQLGFEVLVSPVARRSRDGRERDLFLHRADTAGPTGGLGREDVYVDWLAKRLEGAAHLDRACLEEFHLVRHLRQGKRNADGSRTRARLLRPRALLRGQLTVTDGDAFAELLAHGVGRHRAFGYGMLLLRPSR
jgi:CRISPR system Cascade subunit CasE